MSDQSPQPPERRPPGNPSWVRGGPSPNPKGRPRSGLAFAERVRERIDPDDIIDLAVKVMHDETMTPLTRLQALWPLIDRGFIKPPTTIAAQVETRTMSRDYSHLSLDEARALLAQLRGRVQDPMVTDGGATLSPALVAHAAATTDDE